MLRLEKAMVEFAFIEMLFTCLLKDSLPLMVTPKCMYFESVFVTSFWAWIKLSIWGFLVCYSQNFTFFSVKSYLPLLFSLFKPIQIFLNLFEVSLVADFPVE